MADARSSPILAKLYPPIMRALSATVVKGGSYEFNNFSGVEVMKNILWFLGGIFFFYLGLDALITGETSGFSARGTSRVVTFKTHPIEYPLCVLLLLGFGSYLLKIAIFHKGDN